MNQLDNDTTADKLLAHSFNIQELRVLFEYEEFRSLVSKMRSFEDAEGIILEGSQNPFGPRGQGNRNAPSRQSVSAPR
jgi:hypothetical protein